MIAHDPVLCFCGNDDMECSCPCDDCQSRRDADYALKEQQRMLQTLENLDISIDYLADLIWMRIENEIDRRIQKLVHTVLRERLKTLRLHSRVEGD